ncbi:MAG: MgtC/SapB family protein [Woeseiaceae bacterium]|nr:MgtC/SapB family protein [Woeseiaceae bacterium]
MTPGEVQPELVGILALKIGAAILCGAIIGLERQFLKKSAGLRVCILVVFTTAFFTTLATDYLTEENAIARIIAGIITGVGFLGAGVIFRGGGHVSGITTASLIWALAAIGCTIGLGYPGVAIAVTVVIMLVLGLVDLAEYMFPGLRRKRGSSDDEPHKPAS